MLWLEIYTKECDMWDNSCVRMFIALLIGNDWIQQWEIVKSALSMW